jgi:hypothetical protein
MTPGTDDIATLDDAPPSPRGALTRRLPKLGPSFTRAQKVVGLAAGLISIVSALMAVPDFFKPAPGRGEVVAIIEDAKTGKAVADATVEILSAQNNALVTTLTPNWFGKARHSLAEGQYRVRVSHPKFRAEIQQVQIRTGQTSELRARLRAGPVALDQAERAIKGGVDAVRRLFD